MERIIGQLDLLFYVIVVVEVDGTEKECNSSGLRLRMGRCQQNGDGWKQRHLLSNCPLLVTDKKQSVGVTLK